MAEAIKRLAPFFTDLEYVCDEMRHLICLPYSVANLHRMARELDIKRCWFHRGASYPHYDIPKRRIAEIQAKCRVVSPKELLQIIQAASRIGTT